MTGELAGCLGRVGLLLLLLLGPARVSAQAPVELEAPGFPELAGRTLASGMVFLGSGVVGTGVAATLGGPSSPAVVPALALSLLLGNLGGTLVVSRQAGGEQTRALEQVMAYSLLVRGLVLGGSLLLAGPLGEASLLVGLPAATLAGGVVDAWLTGGTRPVGSHTRKLGAWVTLGPSLVLGEDPRSGVALTVGGGPVIGEWHLLGFRFQLGSYTRGPNTGFREEVALGVHYRFQPTGHWPLAPFAGGGLGFHTLSQCRGDVCPSGGWLGTAELGLQLQVTPVVLVTLAAEASAVRLASGGDLVVLPALALGLAL